MWPLTKICWHHRISVYRPNVSSEIPSKSSRRDKNLKKKIILIDCSIALYGPIIHFPKNRAAKHNLCPSKDASDVHENRDYTSVERGFAVVTAIVGCTDGHNNTNVRRRYLNELFPLRPVWISGSSRRDINLRGGNSIFLSQILRIFDYRSTIHRVTQELKFKRC